MGKNERQQRTSSEQLRNKEKVVLMVWCLMSLWITGYLWEK